MPACRLPVHRTVVLCLCSLALGCVTEQTKDGSFVTGGPGRYGQAAPGSATAKPAVPVKNTDADYKPSPKLQLALAQYQEQRGYRDEARKSYEQVLATDGKSIEAVIGLARLDQVAGRTVDAEAGLQRALQMDPHSGLALDALGQFYAAQQRWNDALSLLQRAQTAAPDDRTIRCHYAIALARVGRIDQAMPLLVESVGTAAAHYNIGVILQERGDLAGSEEQFQSALMANPRLEQAVVRLNALRHEREFAQQASSAATAGDVATAGPKMGPAREGFGGQQAMFARPTAGVADAGRMDAGTPVGQQSNLPGQAPANYDGVRQAAGPSTGPLEVAPAPQLAAPVSPLVRRDPSQPSPDAGQMPQWNSQR
jgi:tetratricopeptide (TPR) repeat protein